VLVSGRVQVMCPAFAVRHMWPLALMLSANLGSLIIPTSSRPVTCGGLSRLRFSTIARITSSAPSQL
jgi:hypothetical protein